MADKYFSYQTVFSSKGDSNFSLPTRLKSRSRKRYTGERRKEVAITRKIGACDVCRKKKIRCTHHILAHTVHASSKGQLAPIDKHRNVASSSIINVDGRDLFNMTSQSSHQTEWNPAALNSSTYPMQSITITPAIHDTNLLLRFGNKRPLSDDSLTDTLPPRRKTIKMVHPSDSIEYSMDNLVLDQMAVENHATLGYGNQILSSPANNQAWSLDLAQTSDNATQLQDVGSTSLDTWMTFFGAPTPEATSWLGEDTPFLGENYSTMNFGPHTDTFQTLQNDAHVSDLSFPDSPSASQNSNLHTKSHCIHTQTQRPSMDEEELEIIASPQKPFWHEF